MPTYRYPPGKNQLSYSESLEIMRMIHEHYRMDIEQIWKRGTVYFTISSALFALVASKELDAGVPKWVVIVFGLIISLFWFMNACLSHHWITVWREKLVEIDNRVNPFRSFKTGEDKGGRLASYFSRPQSYAVALAFLSIVLWLGLGANACLTTTTTAPALNFPRASGNSQVMDVAKAKATPTAKTIQKTAK